MFKVVKQFNDYRVGDVIELNDRRAKSELRNGNVVAHYEPSGKPKQVKRKVEKTVYKNKAYKGTTKKK